MNSRRAFLQQSTAAGMACWTAAQKQIATAEEPQLRQIKSVTREGIHRIAGWLTVEC
jgi:hypothetical protein